MLIPVMFGETAEEIFPIVVRPVDEKTIEEDLNCLRKEILWLAGFDTLAALTVVNRVSRIIGRPL